MSTTTPDLYRPAERPGFPLTSEPVWRERMMIGVGLTALLAVLAIIVSFVALASSTSANAAGLTAAAGRASSAGTPSASAAPAAPLVKPESLTVAIKADVEHGRLGPDGQWHDAFLPADFSVHAGASVTITFVNYDSGPHTFTSPALGVNEVIPGGGSLASPRQATFTFKAPARAGKYEWWCSVPCDPWAMKRNGYMRGIVTVTP